MIKQSTKDRASGKAHEIKGKVKKETGRAFKRPGLQQEGEDEELAGKVQRKVGEVEKVVGY
ncbi:MAG TPA: CsbD family protein [Candidatus Saccharimonadales bacterium]|nr:CsbD family protein [Candidatus Saccharimonadales bacterium]